MSAPPDDRAGKNRLKDETSPYLLQHKDNPVHWWAWGPEALAEAKRTGKPILLSVGYAACHWCHVMAHESFEDEPTANVMNELFVNIKVDREERPDIDAIYMGALHRLGEQGGWPLTMFLDSEARPFWGGTYFPKQALYGRPPFVAVLLRLAEAFQSQPDKVAKNAEALIASLNDGATSGPQKEIPSGLVRELVARLSGAVDPVHGGLAGAPKFPQWSVFWLLWRGAIRFGDEAARQAVLTTLRNICQGGIYDHLGGGFSRYSVDEVWLVPHFEKMLYDNALLLDLLTEAWRETGEDLFRIRIAETVAWLQREMVTTDGAFSASLDADSEGEEGKFYVWSSDEIADVLGDEDAGFFCQAYGVSAEGNFEGHNILNRLSAMTLLDADEEARLRAMREKLLARRAGRVRPGLDDKVLADWNGLMIAALARAAVVFEQPEWLTLAAKAFDAIVTRLSISKGVRASGSIETARLYHAFREGRAKAPATASDYANLIWAALRLLQATGEDRYLHQATAWCAVLDQHYADATSGGYFSTADDTDDVIVRMKGASDDAVPNANAIQLSNLFALAALTGDQSYESRAEALIASFSGRVVSTLVAYCGLLAAQMDRNGIIQVAVTSGGTDKLAESLKGLCLPGALEFHLREEGQAAASPVFAGKLSRDGKSVAYVCVGPTCSAPIVDAEEFRQRLLQARSEQLGL